MTTLVVVDQPRSWPLPLEGAEVVSARSYLTESRWAERPNCRVYNLCRTYASETLGYYVSLLAEARGHRPLPTVETLQDLRLSSLIRIVSQELEGQIERALAKLEEDRFQLPIYFGRAPDPSRDALARAIYRELPAPLLRARFARRDGSWSLEGVRVMSASEIPEEDAEFVAKEAQRHFGRRHREPAGRPSYRFDLAILADEHAEDAPSDPVALSRFVRAARSLGMDAEIIGRDDHAYLAEFDALFLRETTAVDHHTYRLARRAAAEGLVVMDDPVSIVRCTNKVYQAELFLRNAIPCPTTMVAHSGNVDEVIERIGLPCVLKQPDSSFSRGVVKADDRASFERELRRLLDHSELVVAQAFVGSSFDWRIGVLGGIPLFACRYHMARGHWQIAASGPSGRRRFGKVEAVPVEDAPRQAVDVALRATRLIGDGFYGVDIKETEDRVLVMEVNDNPNVDAGCEDGVIGDALYLAVMEWFWNRLEARGRIRVGG